MTTITTVVLAPMVTKDASFDPVKGLTPIANLAMAPMVLLVHQSVPANDFPGFVTWAKQQLPDVQVLRSKPVQSGRHPSVPVPGWPCEAQVSPPRSVPSQTSMPLMMLLPQPNSHVVVS